MTSKTLNNLTSLVIATFTIVCALLIASPALAEEPAPRKPTAQELAILRGLLGMKPAQPAVAAPAPAPSTEAANPAEQPAQPAAAQKSSVEPTAASAVTSDAAYEGRSHDHVARALMAARKVSQKVQL